MVRSQLLLNVLLPLSQVTLGGGDVRMAQMRLDGDQRHLWISTQAIATGMAEVVKGPVGAQFGIRG